MDKPALAIFAALADEIRIIRSKTQVDESVLVKPARIVRGQYVNVPLLIARTGVGTRAMEDAVSYCIRHYNPGVCLNVGYCGGARPELVVGDIIIADRVVDASTSKEFIPSLNLVDEARRKCSDAGVRHVIGGLVTVDEVVSTPHEKAFIGTKFDVRALDMESFAFAHVCEERKVSYVVVRAVLDPMDMKLPPFEDIVDDEGETSVFGAVKHLIKRPKDIFSIPRVEYCATQAREAIATFIDVWLGIHEGVKP